MSVIHRVVHSIFNNWHIKILSLISAVVIVYFNSIVSLENRVITVPLEIQFPENHLPVDALPASVRVDLRGEGDDLVSILSEDIGAVLDMSSYDSVGTYSISVQLDRRGGALDIEPLQITSDPGQVSVKMEAKITKEVPVNIAIQGELLDGYLLVDMVTTPPLVTVSGPQSTVEQITEISTENINITNRTTTSTTESQLIIPSPHVQSRDGDTIRVLLEIVETPIMVSINDIGVVVENISERFSMTYILDESSVRVLATPTTIRKLDNGGIFFAVDGSPINAAGEYMLALMPRTVESAGVVEIVDYQPTAILIQVDAQ